MKGCSTELGPIFVHEVISTVNFESDKQNGEEKQENVQLLPRIQISVHSIGSASFLNELNIIFSGMTWTAENTTMIVTMQQSDYELVKFDPDVDNEKDRLLENFSILARHVCDHLQRAGYFADYFDPCSGLPARTTDSNTIFSEVQAAQSLLGYRVMNANCCKILLHPEWGSAVYPASIVIQAPAAVVVTKVQEILR